MREEVSNMKFKLYCLLSDIEKHDLSDNDKKLLNLLSDDNEIQNLQKNDREDFEEKLMFY
jgi:hypothetical protein